MSPDRRAVRITACDVPSCGQAIIWTRTERGNVMPVDADPTAAGNIVLDATHTDADGRPLAGELGRPQLPGARAAGRELRTHHRLSCTDPAQWSRKAYQP